MSAQVTTMGIVRCCSSWPVLSVEFLSTKAIKALVPHFLSAFQAEKNPYQRFFSVFFNVHPLLFFLLGLVGEFPASFVLSHF
ncbi:hypothetical protein BAU14_00845 [Enterococcus sp. CU9D]|nr:hypothetical protein BAU14_00845 [Enterococcus sp. CU9D]